MKGEWMLRFFISLALAAMLGLALLFGCAREPGQREFRAGLREIERGKNVRALALLEKSITKRPASEENAVAYNYIGIAAWRLGRIPRAVEAFENSRHLDPELVEPIYNLGALYYKGGDFARAATLFETVAQLDSEDTRAMEFLGSIYFQEGKWREARRMLFAALARAPQSPRILTSLALAEIAAGDSDKAIFFLMQALEIKPDYPPALYNLGRLYLEELNDKEQAKAYFKRYLETVSDDEHARDVRRILGRLEGKPVVEVVEAPPRKASQSAVEMNREVPAARARTAEDILKEAGHEAGRGNIQTALNLCLEASALAERNGDTALQEKMLRKGVDLCLDQARAHYELAAFLAAHNQLAEAVKTYKQAIMLEPDFVPAHLGLAEAAIKIDEDDTALVSLKKAIKIAPENPDPLWSLAILYDEKLGLSGKAMDSYRDFERRFPGDPRVVNARARLEASAPAPRPAASAPEAMVITSTPSVEAVASVPASSREHVILPRAVLSAPTGPRRLKIKRSLVRNTQAAVQAYNRGTLYQQREDWDRAIYFYTRALENDDTFVTAFFNLGAVYWAKGDYELAKDAYRRAIDLEPSAISARYNLALMHRELKERDGAIRELRKIIDTTPDYAQAYYVLGLLYAENPDQVDQAKKNYRKFLQLAPNDPVASVVRKWIREH